MVPKRKTALIILSIFGLLILALMAVFWLGRGDLNKEGRVADGPPFPEGEKSESEKMMPEKISRIPEILKEFLTSDIEKTRDSGYKIFKDGGDSKNIIPNQKTASDPSQETGAQEATTSPQEKTDPELENKIFETLYPQYYRDQLSYLQDLLVGEGIIEEENRSAFENEEEIFNFVRIGIQYLKDNGTITQENAQRFLDSGLSEWKKINSQEAEEMRKGELPVSIRSSSAIFCTNNSPFSIFSDFARKIIFGNSAQAQCFQYGASIGPIPGRNLWAPCCICWAGGKSPVPIGCLNAVCIGRNAIWDPVTGICGCDG